MFKLMGREQYASVTRSKNGKFTVSLTVRDADKWPDEDWVFDTIDEAIAKVKEYYS